MTSIERMARALCLSDMPTAEESYVDRNWTGFIFDAKAALAALLPLDEGALERAVDMALGTFDRSDDVLPSDIAEGLTAYLKHIGGEA